MYGNTKVLMSQTTLEKDKVEECRLPDLKTTQLQ